MSSRSLNKVQLIGNLTRDPELRYTPTGAAVCTIGLATNRYWTTESGEKKEETEFHRVVAWNKLAELCSQLLTKGRKIYVEGRLRTSSWQTQSGEQRNTTEVVIEDMILLDSRRIALSGEEHGESVDAEAVPAQHAVQGVQSVQSVQQPAPTATQAQSTDTKKKGKKEDDAPASPGDGTEDVNPDDIPF